MSFFFLSFYADSTFNLPGTQRLLSLGLNINLLGLQRTLSFSIEPVQGCTL
jgi:hypothetical protein